MKSTIGFMLIIALFCTCRQNAITEQQQSGELQIKYQVDRKTGFRHGFYLVTSRNGDVIEEANYNQDTLHGKRKIYYKDGGTVHIIETYRHGIFDGPYTVFHPAGGILQRGYYIDGSMDGRWWTYYESGSIKESVTFEENIENGPFIEFYEHGPIKAEGNYREGDNEHGPLFLYDSSGILERKMICEVGVCKTVWTQDSTFHHSERRHL